MRKNLVHLVETPSGKVNFRYDGDGGRVKKSTVHSQQSIETTYLGSLFEIKSTVNSPSFGSAQDRQPIVKHIFLGSTRICSVDYGPSTIDYHYYHTDHLGSSNIITDETGTKTQLLEYTPYGETWRQEGSTDVAHKFTGQELDASTGLYYYNARYYDPSIGRFTQADTLVTSPGDPQDLNRYSYCRNNPLNLVDPSGHGWFSKIWQSVFSVVSVIASILIPALAPAMWAINMGISAWTAAETGNVMGFVGGLVGGAVFGAIGKELATSLGATLGKSAFTFGGGALIGAVEFGIGGFGAGFIGGLAGGADLGSALKMGGIGAATGAAFGAAIEGSYMAGWQNKLHGATKGDILQKQGVDREVGLYRGYSDITPLGDKLHEGIEIQDNYGDYTGRWEFDTLTKDPLTKGAAVGGVPLPGIWKNRSKPFQISILESTNLDSARTAYNDITSQLGKLQIYNITGFPKNCRTASDFIINHALSVQKK